MTERGNLRAVDLRAKLNFDPEIFFSQNVLVFIPRLKMNWLINHIANTLIKQIMSLKFVKIMPIKLKWTSNSLINSQYKENIKI